MHECFELETSPGQPVVRLWCDVACCGIGTSVCKADKSAVVLLTALYSERFRKQPAGPSI